MDDLVLDRFHDIEDLKRVMIALRGENGCPWDKIQTHESIRQDCLEEAYEVCEAIDENNSEHLKEELGDLLLQVIFHARIEEEKGNFDFNDVCDGISTKLINRHPHVFGDKELYSGAEKYDAWEKAKQIEHGQNTLKEALNGISKTLPSVWRCGKIIKKASKAGEIFDTDIGKNVDKLNEAIKNNEDIEKCYSDLMFSIISNIYDKIDPELALQRACDAYIETLEK